MIKPRCPHCEVPLRRKLQHRVFRYSCPECLGFAVHYGGLKNIMEPETVRMLWASAVTAPVSKISCSHCRQPMRTVYDGAPSSVELDLCRHCDLVWLDTGEWSDLTKNRPPSAPPSNLNLERARIILEIDKIKSERKDFEVRVGGQSDLPPLKAVATLVGLVAEEEPDRFEARPWMTWALIASCVVVFFMSGRHPGLLGFFSYSAGDGAKGLLTALGAFFMHADLWHLAGNMYFLWIFGDNVEDHLGKGKFIALVILAAWLSAFAWAFFDPNSLEVPLVGASGGVSGLVAYYLIRFPARRFVTRVGLLVLVKIPGYFLGLLFLLKEIFGAVAETGGAGNVAHLAHLGGALAGAIFAYVLSPERDLRKRPFRS